MKICDLHTHSNYSDGSLPPAELVRMAENKGLSALALTDHNTAAGLPEFMKAGESSKVITVAGCEFSTEYTLCADDGESRVQELHIVGLFFDESVWGSVEEYVSEHMKNKKISNQNMIKRLQDAGYDITYDEVSAITDAGEFNRAHIARILCRKGYIERPADAFEELLKEGCGFYIPPKRPDVFETIKFIKKNGAVSVLAHPFLELSADELRCFLRAAKPAGLDAIETNYSKFDDEMIKQACAIASEMGLARSGGSDFHGDAKPDVEMGTGRGSLEVPFDYYEDLRSIIT